jgi:uncharacterized BrkB/YihY/UPF0761 family membrane protein
MATRRDTLLERRDDALAFTRDRLPGGSVVLEALERERESGGGLLAGGLAYRLFLWLVPFGLTIAAVLGLWATEDPDSVQESAREFGIGAAAAETIATDLSGSGPSRTSLLAVGLLATLWFSLGTVRALRLAASIAWQLKPTRVPHPFHAVVAFNGLFLADFAAAAVLAWLRDALGLGVVVAAVTLVAVPTATAFVAFWLLPRRSDDWRDLLPGAILVGLGTQALQVAMVVYFAPKLESSSQLYGALGVAVTILVYLYVVARLVSISLFLDATLWERRALAAAAPSPG